MVRKTPVRNALINRPVAALPAIYLILGLLAGCSKTPPCQNYIEAFVISQEFIKRELKAPSTATFPNINADGVSSIPSEVDGRCAFDVSIYVDAQNSFGAQIRTQYSVKVAPDQTGSWDLISIESL